LEGDAESRFGFQADGWHRACARRWPLGEASKARAVTALTESSVRSIEAKMEGVVYHARRDGANFDVSVVSDAQGQ